MDDLISRRELFKRIRIYEEEYGDKLKGIAYIKFLIRDTPTIEAEPVKHGRWLDNPNQSQLYSYICSNCRNSCDWTYQYCPNCGSKNRMDGDSE